MFMQNSLFPVPHQECALVVEQSIVIGMAAEMMLIDLGIHFVHLSSSVQGAISVLERYSFDFALVDLELDYESGLIITRRLRAEGIPTIFSTVDDQQPFLPAPLKIVRKPYSKEQLKMALL
jgi:CheY-like chemotaxis protein